MNLDRDLRGLSLTRPWASAFLDGGKVAAKRIENRSWRPPRGFNGYIALHSAKSYDLFAQGLIRELTGRESVECEAGQIFAVARFIGVATHILSVELAQRRWFVGPDAWVLDDFRAIEPVHCKGALGLWRLSSLASIVWERYQTAWE